MWAHEREQLKKNTRTIIWIKFISIAILICGFSSFVLYLIFGT